MSEHLRDARSDYELDGLETLDARQFEVVIRRLADSLSFGADRSPFLGSGVEYVQSRVYQPGDPVRTIDWRLTARTGEPYVKQFEAPRQIPIVLLFDTSASMTVRSTEWSKYALAVFIAGGLALASLERLSPVGLLGMGSRSLFVRPSLSKATIMQWLHRLRRYRLDEHTLFSSRLPELHASLHQRSMVIVLSDLHDRSAVPGLKNLAQQHDVVVIQLADPAEKGVRGAGFLRAREAETGRAFVGRSNSRWIDQDATAKTLERAGIDHLLVTTDEPYVHLLRRFLKERGVFARTAR